MKHVSIAGYVTGILSLCFSVSLTPSLFLTAYLSLSVYVSVSLSSLSEFEISCFHPTSTPQYGYVEIFQPSPLPLEIRT